MKNRVQNKVTPEVLAKHNRLTDEYMFRELAKKMMGYMPYDDLQKIMTFTKIDPYSEHSEKVLRDRGAPDWLKDQIRTLREQDVVLFEADCTV